MPSASPKASRIEAFSDGVIAIVLTIMVLELKVPEQVGEQGIGLGLLTSLLPKLVPYIMSFIVIAIMWVNHHRLLDAAHRADNTLLWANIHLLFWMTLIPISTAFVGQHLFEPVAIAAYGFVLTGRSTAFTLLRWCVTRDERGMLSARYAASVKKSVIATVIYGASIPLAYISVYLSMAIFVILPALFVLPDFLLPRWAVNAPEKRRR